MSAPYVQTFTPVIGNLACNANCPYCCSKMTCDYGLDDKNMAENWDNFDIAAQIARERQCITAFITSKGEATLFPSRVIRTIVRLVNHGFPLIELQTNGIRLLHFSGPDDSEKPGTNGRIDEVSILQKWKFAGLNLICISAVHWDLNKNRQIFGHRYNELRDTVKVCLDVGLKVRISCVMIKDFVDDVESVIEMRKHCTEWGADQLVIRPVSKPSKCLSENDKWRMDWIDKNIPSEADQKAIFEWLEANSGASRNLAHGAKVYSVQLEKGKPEVNVCLANCFTPPSKDGEVRQIIWLPNGTITDNWDHEGLVIL